MNIAANSVSVISVALDGHRSHPSQASTVTVDDPELIETLAVEFREGGWPV